MTVFGFALDVEGIESALATAVVTGVVIGAFFVVLTLVYGRASRQ